MPVGNLGNIGVYMKNGKLFASFGGTEYLQLSGTLPAYVDSIGNIFYCADGRGLFVSANCLSWEKFTFQDEITSLKRFGNALLVNDAEAVDVSELLNATALKFGDEFCELSTPVLESNDEIYIPLRALCNAVGASVSWDAETATAKVTYQGRECLFSEHNFDGIMYITENMAEEMLSEAVTAKRDVIIIG